MVINVDTELRKLRSAEFYKFGLILNPSDNWKKLVASVKQEGSESIPKFPGEYITIVEQAAHQQRKLAAQLFLEEWATMGKKRPTVGLLLKLLMETELFRAADYLAEDILKVPAPQRPTSGPAAAVDIEADLLLRESVSTSNDSDFRGRTTNEMQLSQVSYPMHVLDSEATTNDDNLEIGNDIGVIEMQCAQSRSNQVLEPVTAFDSQKSSKNSQTEILENLDTSKSSEEISDLMKFSASDSQNFSSSDSQHFEEVSKSDVLKFDSKKMDSTDETEAVFPKLSLLGISASKTDSNLTPNYPEWQNGEMSSSELPACL